MVKSLYQFNYKKSYFGNMAIIWAFFLHILLLIINIIIGTKFSSINLEFRYIKNKQPLPDKLYYFIIPNILYLLFELYVTWICYSYSKHLSEGNDALVDGQNFDRYTENLNSESQSANINIEMDN